MKKQDRRWIWTPAKEERTDLRKKLFPVLLCVTMIGFLLPSKVHAGGLEGNINEQLYNMFKQQQGQASMGHTTTLSPANLLDNPALTSIYHEDRVWIYKFTE